MWRILLLAALALGSAFLIIRWLERPPRKPDDLCSVFAEKRGWYRNARSSFRTYGVPEAVQMAVIHQESHFRARARPPRRWYLWVIPGRRPTSAYGYAQAIDATWRQFQVSTGRPDADRHDFADAVHFVGWYGSEIHRLTGIEKDDAYNLYLAYHEGPAGYRRGSHQKKAWLLDVARWVGERARTYQRQYDGCAARLEKQPWWPAGAVAAVIFVLVVWRRLRGRRR